MPKMRSHSGTKKRLKVTGSGEFKRQQAGTRHLAPGKTQKQTRQLRKSSLVSTSDKRRLRKQLSILK